MFKKIYVEITNSCNLNCSFCIGHTRKKEFITIDKFKLLLDKIKNHTDYLYFHLMGEPLIHPYINDLIDIASNNFNTNITTNGYFIDRIKDNKHIRQINISLHS
jgi:MoaA/NifB/PqqE/SkfB family radical SAM enzyme